MKYKNNPNEYTYCQIMKREIHYNECRDILYNCPYIHCFLNKDFSNDFMDDYKEPSKEKFDEEWVNSYDYDYDEDKNKYENQFDLKNKQTTKKWED